MGGQLGRDRVSTVLVVLTVIAAALELRVAEVVEISVTSEVVTAWLPELVWQARAGGVAWVRGELTHRPNIDIRNGEVRIDLVPVITQALQETQADRRHVTPRSHRGGMTDARA